MKKKIDFSNIRAYHGSPYRIETFDPQYLGGGTDQLGSGFYCTTKRQSARGFCEAKEITHETLKGLVLSPTLHVLNVRLSSPLDNNLAVPITFSQFRDIVTRAPELDDVLTNFGEVDREGISRLIERASISYIGNDETPLIGVLCNLCNDFYPDHPHEFNLAIRDVLGFDSVVSYYKDETIICAWFPESIEIIARKDISLERHDSGIEP